MSAVAIDTPPISAEMIELFRRAGQGLREILMLVNSRLFDGFAAVAPVRLVNESGRMSGVFVDLVKIHFGEQTAHCASGQRVTLQMGDPIWVNVFWPGAEVPARIDTTQIGWQERLYDMVVAAIQDGRALYHEERLA